MGNPKSKVIVQVDPETQPSARRKLRIAVVSRSVFSVMLLIAPPAVLRGCMPSLIVWWLQVSAKLWSVLVANLPADGSLARSQNRHLWVHH
jgi:hypothetical protein